MIDTQVKDYKDHAEYRRDSIGMARAGWVVTHVAEYRPEPESPSNLLARIMIRISPRSKRLMVTYQREQRSG